MTEEIIIDGVDVAGCEFYLQDEKHSCDLSFINQEELCKCDDVQDCTYKQLKRLEQENKELKAELNKIIDEREKKIEETLLKGCYQSLGSECRIYELKESKYRSALEEINRVVKLAHKVEDYLLGQDYTDLVDRIEKEINEVLNEG